MNFDRNYTTPTTANKNSQKLIGKIQKLPIVKRVYLYILLLAAIGAVMGEAKISSGVKKLYDQAIAVG